MRHMVMNSGYRNDKLSLRKKKNHKSKYISHNKNTKEIYFDKFNIDFLRYYKPDNFIFAFLGSIIGVLLWIYLESFINIAVLIEINVLYIFTAICGGAFFVLTAYIAYVAGNTKKESARLAGRRGLFTFSVMMVTVLIMLIVTGTVTAEQQFYYFVKYFIIGMISAALFAVPMDYGIGFMKGFFKKKRYDMV